MIIRSAVLEGEVAAADVAKFDAHMRDNVLPAIANYPGLQSVRLRKMAEPEVGAPPVYMVFDLYFADLATMHAALASDVRQAVRKVIAEGMALFKGKVYHLVLDETDRVEASSIV